MTPITQYVPPLPEKEAPHTQRRYILTGAPGAGKTPLINRFKEMGIKTIAEAAKDVILEQSLVKDTTLTFRDKIVLLQKRRELEAVATDAETLFFDRSPIDTLSFAIWYRHKPEERLLKEVRRIVSNQYYERTVFLIEMLSSIEKTEVRKEDYEESLLIQNILEESYRSLHFRVIRIPAATIEKRTEAILASIYPIAKMPIVTPIQIGELLEEVAESFKDESVSFGLKELTIGNKRFFGIRKEEQNAIEYTQVRARLLQGMGLSPLTEIVQVVGDSAKFSTQGTKAGMRFLNQHLLPNQLVMWGFTGLGNRGEPMLDVNQLVGQWALEDEGRIKRLLANVADFCTIRALKEWNFHALTETLNYLMVYSEVDFGDDIHTTDSLTDIALCLDGGAQSFGQLVNLLAKGKTVFGIYGLRGESNPAFYDQENKRFVEHLSASEFFGLLKEEIEKKGIATPQEIEAFKVRYLATRVLFNPKRHDACTKQKLFDGAWKVFMEERLWIKLKDCRFQKAAPQ